MLGAMLSCVGTVSRLSRWSADGHHNAAEALYHLGRIKEAEKHCDYALSLMEDSKELQELKQKITNKNKLKKITNFFIKR